MGKYLITSVNLGSSALVVGFFRTPVYLTTESASELKKFLSNA